MWYQESLRKFQIPERIEDAHPSLQPGFRAMAERFTKVTWEGLVAETLAFGSPDTVARHIEQMREHGRGPGAVLDELRRPAPGQDPPLHGALRPRGHAPLPRLTARGAILAGDMAYNAWFQCINGCPGEFDLREVIYRCPTCGDLLEVQHDMDALRVALGRRVDAALRRPLPPQHLALRLRASGARRSGWCPSSTTRTSCRCTRAASNLLWADRYGKQLGVEDLWVKQCGNSHTGSFKDLGMTVLVSVVKQMIADGAPIDAVACASTGDTSAALGAYCAAAGIPVGGAPAARTRSRSPQLVQPLANGALVLSLDTDFDGCMAIVQEITKEKRIYLANSMNSLRIEGQKTVAIEIVQQFDWEVPDWIVIPGGNLGNVSALGAGLPDDAGARADPASCRASAWPRPSGPTRSTASFQDDFKTLRADHRPADAGHARSRSATRSASSARSARCSASTAWSSRPPSRSWPTRRRAPTAPACSTARTPAWRWPRCGSWSTARSSAPASAWWCISTANGLKFADQKAAYHMGTLEGIKPHATATSRSSCPPTPSASPGPSRATSRRRALLVS